MNYNEAYSLSPGDKVVIEDTKEQRTVESISGTLNHIFILLDNGREYHQSELGKGISCTE